MKQSPKHEYAHAVNSKMPSNLYLLSGDIDLDLCSRIISHIASSPVKGAWKASRSLFIDLIEAFEFKSMSEQKKATFFIDCNPSLANYTELALLASNRLIIPCTADASSIRGMRNLVKLIFGINLGKTELTDDFLNFHQEAVNHQFELPKLHVFVQNRSRTLDKEATRAYTAHSEEIVRLTEELKTKHPEIFTDLQSELVRHVKDGNTLASIINHEGCALSSVKSKKYSIYGKDTQANQEQIDALLMNINDVMNTL